MKKIHLLLVDDQVLFIQSLKNVIESIAKDIFVDDIADNGQAAIDAAEKYRPAVILMDVRMPKINGVEATAIIRKRFPDTQVIILTTYDDDEYVQAALQAGAVGYLLKDISPRELIPAIRAIGKGAFLISPTIAKRLLRQPHDRGPDHDSDTRQKHTEPSWLKQLSKREREILRFISYGMSNREIAEALFIAEQTVKNYVSVVYSKIGENYRYNVIEKIKECIDMGFGL